MPTVDDLLTRLEAAVSGAQASEKIAADVQALREWRIDHTARDESAMARIAALEGRVSEDRKRLDALEKGNAARAWLDKGAIGVISLIGGILAGHFFGG